MIAQFVILGLLYFMLFLSTFWIVVFIDNLPILWEDPKPKKKYSISVLVPAYNEEKSVSKTIDSLLKMNYPKELYEIIVINDGSTDRTREICEAYAKKGLIRLLNKKNGGKASALNLGVKNAKGELIFVLDSDSFADKNCFNYLIGYFNNPKVAAVTSSMRAVGNESFVQKIQWLEYYFSIVMRKVMSLFNSLYVTPGPGSIYRKSVIEEVGGFSEKTLTEDMEIAFNIQDHGYAIENSLNSVVCTSTPAKLFSLIKQRRRWYVGFIEDSMKYRHFYFNRKKGFLGWFLLPTNILNLFSLIFLTLYTLYHSFKGTFANVSNLNAINFDIFPMLANINWKLSLFSIDTFSVLGVMFLFLSLIIIYFSLKTSNQKVNLKRNLANYALYILFYSLLMSLFWTDSLIYKLAVRRKMEGWRYGQAKS